MTSRRDCFVEPLERGRVVWVPPEEAGEFWVKVVVAYGLPLTAHYYNEEDAPKVFVHEANMRRPVK